MKHVVFIALLLIFSAGTVSAAVTIEASAKLNKIYNYPIKINTTFGKLPSADEYGIFVNTTCKAEEGEREKESLFFRLSSGITKDGKALYTEVKGKKILLAEKKWYGWIPAEGIEIQYRVQREPYAAFTVWVEADQG